MRCVRVWFEKMGMSRYVSHLDLMRAMTRTLRRARVPLWYTEGYNPHPYITFTLPLSLGMESLCESMDMRIEGDCSNEDIFNMLKDTMPPGIRIIKVTDPLYDPKLVAFGEFDIFFDCKKNPEGLMALVEKRLSGDEFIVQKLGKKGRSKVLKDINLIEFIRSYRMGHLSNRVKLTVVLPAGSTTNINPSLIADAIMKECDDCISYTLVRKKLMTESMEEFR